MKINIMFLGIAAAVILGSCDDRDDYFSSKNEAPVIKIEVNGLELESNSFVDSLKIGLDYRVKYVVNDKESVFVNVLQEKGNDEYEVKNDSVRLKGKSEGFSKFYLMAKDEYGAVSKFPLEFTVFRNVAPVAVFTTSLVGISSPYEYEVNAETSYDKDVRFGGKIVLYEYTFGSYTFTSVLSKVRYVFGSAGQKLISVRVKDNSGDWSPKVSLYVTLN